MVDRTGCWTPKASSKLKIAFLPRRPTSEVEGANHAYFSDYGAQSGDGEATVSREEARGEIVSASSALIDRVRSKGLQNSAPTGSRTP